MRMVKIKDVYVNCDSIVDIVKSEHSVSSTDDTVVLKALLYYGATGEDRIVIYEGSSEEEREHEIETTVQHINSCSQTSEIVELLKRLALKRGCSNSWCD